MGGRFDAHDVAIELVRALRPLVERMARRDRDLASQLRRAASSVPMNLAEGAARSGADRLHHYRIAAGSAAEIRTALILSEAWGLLDAPSLSLSQALLDRVIAMLHRLTHSRR